MAKSKEEERNSLLVNVKKINPDAKLPTYAHDTDACFDLYAAETKIVEPGETVTIGTGLVFEIPEGHEMQIRPRSGISRKTKVRLPNSPGIIDSGYRGEVGIIIENTTHKRPEYTDKILTLSGKDADAYREAGRMVFVNTMIIHKGERIAQAAIVPLPKIKFNEVEEVSKTDRGETGYGGSGIK